MWVDNVNSWTLNILTAQWEEDYTQTNELSYTVEYYQDGEKVEADTITVTWAVWVNDPQVLTVGEIDTDDDKYEGYKFDSTDPEEIPETVEDGAVIKVKYVKDESQTNELSYTEIWCEAGKERV